MPHRTIRMGSIDAKTSEYIDFDVGNNDKYSKFKTGDLTLISTITTFLQNVTLQIGPKTFMLCYSIP